MSRLYNYHTHTCWCKHAKGSIEAYIQEAIRLQYREIAITDHMPYCYKCFCRSMLPEQFETFDSELNQMVQKYQGQIRVRKGMECEYYPDYRNFYQELRDRGYEILLLSEHNSRDQSMNFFHSDSTQETEVYRDELCEAIETGLFDIVAHPDLFLNIQKTFSKEADAALRAVFKACEKQKMIVELNAEPFRDKRRGYSNENSYQLAKQYDLTFVVGSDCHRPEDLEDKAVLEALNKAEEWGLPLLQLGQLERK